MTDDDLGARVFAALVRVITSTDWTRIEPTGRDPWHGA